MDKGTRAIVEKKLKRARAAYREAQILAGAQEWMGCASRMYYACFHAASALLLTRNLAPKSHAGIRTLLGEHFAKTSKISPDLVKTYNELFLLRQLADYGDLFAPHATDVSPLMEQTEAFISAVERLIGASD